MRKKIALAFSGGLDTRYCVPWLQDNYDADVTTVTVDVGGGGTDRADALGELSRQLGAVQHVHIDARQVFYDEILAFLIMGNVLRGGVYPLSVGAERSLQAREAARVARDIGAMGVAHGCTGAGNDQVRFEIALRTVAPELEIIAPIRDFGVSREDEVRLLTERGLPLPPEGGAYSINDGLWGVTIGGKETLDTRESIPEAVWQRTRGAFDGPVREQRHVLSFERGHPVAWDGQPADPVTLIERIDAAAGGMGIGRGIHLGETILGLKGRVAFEAPAATVLITAHRELEKLVLTGAQMSVKEGVSAVYGAQVHEGHFLSPVCRDIEALLLSSQARVTGDVHLLLRTGSVFVEGVTSPHSLKAASRGVYGEAAGEWTTADARGFCRLKGLADLLHSRAGG